MNDEIENLRLYASIYEKPRRYFFGDVLHPPKAADVAIARALRSKADELEKASAQKT